MSPLSRNGKVQLRRDASRTIECAKKINSFRLSTSKGKQLSGRKYKDLEQTLNGIWWILCTGCIWNQLPEKYGKWNSVWRCFDRLCKSGFWVYALDQIGEEEAHLKGILIVDGSHVKAHQDSTRSPLTAEEQKLGKTKGGWNTKISSCVNAFGLPVSSKIVCGQEFDGKSIFEVLPDDFKGSFILADKAYDTNYIRKVIAENGGTAVIPPKKNRVAKIDYDREIGKLRRKVENFFGRIKRFRRVATRYEQKPENYFGFVTLASIKDWMT